MAADSWSKMQGKSKEDMQKGFDEWMKWKESCGDGLVDMGSPLGNGKLVNKDTTTEAPMGIAGYSILQAESIEKALEMVKNHPHLMWDKSCTITVYEAMPMG